MSTLARAVGGAATAGVAAFDANVAREEVRGAAGPNQLTLTTDPDPTPTPTPTPDP